MPRTYLGSLPFLRLAEPPEPLTFSCDEMNPFGRGEGREQRALTHPEHQRLDMTDVPDFPSPPLLPLCLTPCNERAEHAALSVEPPRCCLTRSRSCLQGLLQGEEPQRAHEEPCRAGEEGGCSEAERERGRGRCGHRSRRLPPPASPAGRERRGREGLMPGAPSPVPALPDACQHRERAITWTCLCETNMTIK